MRRLLRLYLTPRLLTGPRVRLLEQLWPKTKAARCGLEAHRRDAATRVKRRTCLVKRLTGRLCQTSFWDRHASRFSVSPFSWALTLVLFFSLLFLPYCFFAGAPRRGALSVCFAAHPTDAVVPICDCSGCLFLPRRSTHSLFFLERFISPLALFSSTFSFSPSVSFVLRIGSPFLSHHRRRRSLRSGLSYRSLLLLLSPPPHLTAVLQNKGSGSFSFPVSSLAGKRLFRFL